MRAHLSKLLTALNLDTKGYSFHTFRRSGVTLAFNNNVSIQNIKRHGTWLSDTVHTYILSDPCRASAVSDFKNYNKVHSLPYFIHWVFGGLRLNVLYMFKVFYKLLCCNMVCTSVNLAAHSKVIEMTFKITL